MSFFRLILAVVFVLASLGVARGDTVINFDDLTPGQIINDGGGDIGTFYSAFGVTFGTNISGLDQSTSGTGAAYPAHSSPIVAIGLDNTVSVLFSGPQTSVSFYYTSLDPVTLTALDSIGHSLGENTFSANTDGTTGVSSFASIEGTGISSIEISATAGSFVFDDFAFSGAATSVPESNFSLLLGLALALIAIGKYSCGAAIRTQ